VEGGEEDVGSKDESRSGLISSDERGSGDDEAERFMVW
jgi:hypothetical protein